MGSSKNGTTFGVQVGDVVRLKSGDPRMTVESVGGLISCAWFAGGHAKRGFFDLDMLEQAPDAESLT